MIEPGRIELQAIAPVQERAHPEKTFFVSNGLGLCARIDVPDLYSRSRDRGAGGSLTLPERVLVPLCAHTAATRNDDTKIPLRILIFLLID